MIRPVLVDSNILIDIFTDSPQWAQWSRDRLTVLSQSARLYINPVVYSEISVAFSRIETLDGCLALLPLKMETMPKEALFLAGKAFLQYRRSTAGTKTSTLPDFFIGAHAAVNGWRLLTRDPKRMKYYFPGLDIIAPD